MKTRNQTTIEAALKPRRAKTTPHSRLPKQKTSAPRKIHTTKPPGQPIETSPSTELTINGRRLPLSHLDKVLYPKTGFTKAQVIHYYIQIGRYILPHLKNRALTLKRYPNGVDQPFFYEKRCPAFRPNWVKTAPIWSEGNNEYINYCLANDLPTLVWAANLACLELHTSLALSKNSRQPTVMAFDLDPGPPANIVQCARVALWLREIFEKLKLKSFPKTSGSKGLQIYVPLNGPVTFDDTKKTARDLAQQLTRDHPAEVLADMSRKLREGKVFIDWSQNDAHKTTVCAYSLRAKDRPTVSTPVTWAEVEKTLRTGKPETLTFETDEVARRVAKHGDLFEPVLTLKQKLPK